MAVTITGYISYTGQAVSGWIASNDLYFSGIFRDMTGFDYRLLIDQMEILQKVSLDPTFNNFIALQTTFRNQMFSRISELSSKVEFLQSSLISARGTLANHETRITNLE